jgi:hypothetical protein
MRLERFLNARLMEQQQYGFTFLYQRELPFLLTFVARMKTLLLQQLPL